MTRVLIVDDHEFFRSCLIDLVNASDDLEAVGECADGSEVAQAVETLRPHVVLMDLRMGEMSGIEAAGALQRMGAVARVLIMTTDTCAHSRGAARANGAAGYLIKGVDATVLLDAVRRVACGGTAWPEDFADGALIAS